MKKYLLGFVVFTMLFTLFQTSIAVNLPSSEVYASESQSKEKQKNKNDKNSKKESGTASKDINPVNSKGSSSKKSPPKEKIRGGTDSGKDLKNISINDIKKAVNSRNSNGMDATVIVQLHQVVKQYEKACPKLTDFGCEIEAYVKFFLSFNALLLKGISISLIENIINPGSASSPVGKIGGWKIADHPEINTYYQFMKDLAWVLVELFLVYHVIRFLSMYWIHQNAEYFKTTLWKLLFTAILISVFPDIFKYILKLNTLIGQAITDQAANIQQMKDMPLSYEDAVIYAIMFIVMFVMFFVVCIQLLIRYAELTFLYILAPIAIASNLNREMNLMPIWWKTLLSVAFTQSVQILLINVMLSLLVSPDPTFYNYASMMAFLVLIIKSPAFLKEWMYSTGAGGSAVALGKTVAKMVLKKAKK